MNAFDKLAAEGNLLGITMQIPNLMIDLREILAACGNDPFEATANELLRDSWRDAAPESRAAVLVSFAWGSRSAEIKETSSPADMCAHDLNEYARAHEGDSESFHGPGFPQMPLPGQAGALAASVAFDRDDWEISLTTALLLLEKIPAQQPEG